MIYLDNSASTFFKPDCVVNAVKNALDFLPANPGRSGHSLSNKGAMLVQKTRDKLCRLVNLNDGDAIFTANCTDALNLAILGGIKRGHIITTVFEHNSVLRPLYELKRQNKIEITVVSPKNGYELTAEDFTRAFRRDTVAVVAVHISNVTGAISPLFKLGELCRQHGALFIVDGAQSVGYTTVDMDRSNIDMLAIAPHKGLHATQGVGVLMVRRGVKLTPIRYGGTGTSSHDLSQPIDIPDGFETGTLPTPAIAGLCSAISWCERMDSQNKEIIKNLSDRLICGLKDIDGVTLFRPDNALNGIASFSIDGLSSDFASNILSSQYDICVRSGLHCAPLTHAFLGTQKNGLIRISLGCDNTIPQIDYTVSVIREICKKH